VTTGSGTLTCISALSAPRPTRRQPKTRSRPGGCQHRRVARAPAGSAQLHHYLASV